MTTAAALVVVIPYTPFRMPFGNKGDVSNLSPNGDGKHGNTLWKSRAGKAQMREDAYYWTLHALKGQSFPIDVHAGIPVRIELRRNAKGKAPDQDNLVASCKAALDGISDALVVDDRHFRIAGVTVTRTAGQEETVFRVGGGA